MDRKKSQYRVLSLDVGRTFIKSALFDERGQITESKVTASNFLYGDELILRAIGVTEDYSRYDAIAVALSGQIDTRSQTVIFEYRNEFNKKGRRICRPVGDIFRQRFSTPVYVMNDSTAAALGEARYGAGKDTADFVCLTYGTGIGGGLIINHEVYEGSCGIAAEFGHIVTHKGGRLCGCGNRGCYEQYASTTALIEKARKEFPSVSSGMELFSTMQHGKKVERIIREWADEVIVGLETITYILNPSMIVLGGGILERQEVINLIKTRFYSHVIPTFSDVEIRAAELRNRAGLYGAYAYAMQKLEQR